MNYKEALFQVKKPGRYLGKELNSVHKSPDAHLRVALAYPDLYEIGMSNLGLSILYFRLNKEEDIWCERVFAPGPDLEEIMRQEHLPLFSLESQTPLNQFDLLGFSLQYEMTFPQVLNMLELGGIPFRAALRKASDPVVIAGGPCTCNPEPMAPFFDGMLLGDGEEAVVEIARVVQQFRESHSLDRHQLWEALSKIPGVYAPSLYKPIFSDEGFLKGWEIEGGAPWPVGSRKLKDLDSAFFPGRPILPGIETVHDRAQVELFRGCLHGCRFCQAGYIYRPLRMRSKEKVAGSAKEIILSTGWEELGLVSLSTCDYPFLEELLEDINPFLRLHHAQVSLPSLRVDSFSVHLARLAEGANITLTFAPEAGSEHLREIINKGLKREEIQEAIELACQCDFQRIKLYFMVGLPREEKDDIGAILEIVDDLRKRAKKISGKVKISVSVSAFVPKPQTPFQWEKMEEVPLLKSKRLYLRQGLEKIGVKSGGQKEELSMLEGLIARGDRRVSRLIEEAYKLGSRLDGWSDFFSFPLWQEAIRKSEIDLPFYLYRERKKEETLPWEGAFYTAGPAYLWQERERAYSL